MCLINNILKYPLILSTAYLIFVAYLVFIQSKQKIMMYGGGAAGARCTS
jgi:hypothetical protein